MRKEESKIVSKGSGGPHKSVWFLIFVIILLAGVVFVQISNLYVRNQELESQAQALEEELERARELEMELEAYREFIKSDEYIEELARERLNLIMPDEMKIIPID